MEMPRAKMRMEIPHAKPRRMREGKKVCSSAALKRGMHAFHALASLYQWYPQVEVLCWMALGYAVWPSPPRPTGGGNRIRMRRNAPLSSEMGAGLGVRAETTSLRESSLRPQKRGRTAAYRAAQQVSMGRAALSSRIDEGRIFRLHQLPERTIAMRSWEPACQQPRFPLAIRCHHLRIEEIDRLLFNRTYFYRHR